MFIETNLKKRPSLTEAAKNGTLESQLRRYLKSCFPPDENDVKKKGGKFPNLAGFCRFLGCGLSEFQKLRDSEPDAADYLLAVMEDEALNSALLPATLASAYLKNRLEYAKKEKGEESSADCGEMRVIFEHDIAEDGA